MKIVQAFSGTIYLEDTHDDVGTSFVFTIKCNSETEERSHHTVELDQELVERSESYQESMDTSRNLYERSDS